MTRILNAINNAGFKIGDRITITNADNYLGYPVGSLGTVTDTGTVVFRAKMDNLLIASEPDSTGDGAEALGFAPGWTIHNEHAIKVES